jgi:hypothetical protein
MKILLPNHYTRAVAEFHQPAPFFSEFAANEIDKPQSSFVSSQQSNSTSFSLGTHTQLVTCADPRCSLEYYLNLKPNDRYIHHIKSGKVNEFISLLMAEGVIVLCNLCGHATFL